MDYIIREMKESEYHLLNDFLYEAVFIPEGLHFRKRVLFVYLNYRYILLTSAEKKVISVWQQR